jgi:hypothetical protein
LTLQTSCFKLVLGVQQAPLGTGRPAFCGDGAAKAMAAKRTTAAKVDFIFADLVVLIDYGSEIEELLVITVKTEPAVNEVKECERLLD